MGWVGCVNVFKIVNAPTKITIHQYFKEKATSHILIKKWQLTRQMMLNNLNLQPNHQHLPHSRPGTMSLFARKTGSGPSIIILHGLYGCSDNWMSIARELSSGYTVYSLDLRNHGKSPHHKEHTYRAMTEDVAEWMEQERIPQSVVLGHSMGGKVAVWLAATHPEKVSALILVDIAPVPYASTQQFSPHVVEHLNVINALTVLDVEHLRSRHEADRALSQSIPDVRMRQFLLKNLQRNEQGCFYWSINLKALRRSLPEILGGMDSLNLGTSKYITNIPSLCIRGEKSSYVGPDEQVFLQKVIPGIKIVTIPDAGHWVHAEQPAAFLNIVRNFLKNSTKQGHELPL